MFSRNKSDRCAPLPAGTILNAPATKCNNLLNIEDALARRSLIARIAHKLWFTTKTSACYEGGCEICRQKRATLPIG